ncbi:MAG: hypothetical protein POELPBGB_03899 [Bacteroidia bacterium]|nr:hypothetical protein [Bacteroidia bacterium]
MKLEDEYFHQSGINLNLVLAYLEHVEEEGFPSFGIDKITDYKQTLELLARIQDNKPFKVTFSIEETLLLYAAGDISNKLLVIQQGEEVFTKELQSVVGAITKKQFLNFRAAHTALNIKIMDVLKSYLEDLPEFKQLNEKLASLNFI